MCCWRWAPARPLPPWLASMRAPPRQPTSGPARPIPSRPHAARNCWRRPLPACGARAWTSTGLPAGAGGQGGACRCRPMPSSAAPSGCRRRGRVAMHRTRQARQVPRRPWVRSTQPPGSAVPCSWRQAPPQLQPRWPWCLATAVPRPRPWCKHCARRAPMWSAWKRARPPPAWPRAGIPCAPASAAIARTCSMRCRRSSAPWTPSTTCGPWMRPPLRRWSAAFTACWPWRRRWRPVRTVLEARAHGGCCWWPQAVRKM